MNIYLINNTPGDDGLGDNLSPNLSPKLQQQGAPYAWVSTVKIIFADILESFVACQDKIFLTDFISVNFSGIGRQIPYP